MGERVYGRGESAAGRPWSKVQVDDVRHEKVLTFERIEGQGGVDAVLLKTARVYGVDLPRTNKCKAKQP